MCTGTYSHHACNCFIGYSIDHCRLFRNNEPCTTRDDNLIVGEWCQMCQIGDGDFGEFFEGFEGFITEADLVYGDEKNRGKDRREEEEGGGVERAEHVYSERGERFTRWMEGEGDEEGERSISEETFTRWAEEEVAQGANFARVEDEDENS